MSGVTFDRDEFGFPVAQVSGYPGLTSALEDSVSARRPKGIGGPSVSTHWVDWVLHRIEANRGNDSAVELASGNVTRLVVHGDRVRAESLYDLFDPEEVPTDEAVDLLRGYRSEIVRVAGSDEPQPFLKPPHEVWVAGNQEVELRPDRR